MPWQQITICCCYLLLLDLILQKGNNDKTMMEKKNCIHVFYCYVLVLSNSCFFFSKYYLAFMFLKVVEKSQMNVNLMSVYEYHIIVSEQLSWYVTALHIAVEVEMDVVKRIFMHLFHLLT